MSPALKACPAHKAGVGQGLWSPGLGLPCQQQEHWARRRRELVVKARLVE